MNLKRIHSQAKVLGTVITVTGAMVMTLYKGPIVDILWYSHHGDTTTHTAAGSSSADQHWLAGTIMILVCTCSWAGYFILQVCLLLTFIHKSVNISIVPYHIYVVIYSLTCMSTEN